MEDIGIIMVKIIRNNNNLTLESFFKSQDKETETGTISFQTTISQICTFFICKSYAYMFAVNCVCVCLYIYIYIYGEKQSF